MDVAESKDGEESSSPQKKIKVVSTIGSSSTLTKHGQRFATPSPGNGDRVFYESLYEQSEGKSVMAQEWCVSYGVLDDAEAEKAYGVVSKRKGIKISSNSSQSPLRTSAGAGSSSSSSSNPSTNKANKLKSKIVDEGVELINGFENAAKWETTTSSGW